MLQSSKAVAKCRLHQTVKLLVAQCSCAGSMKGTEVPNPRRSNACDCTCRNRSLSRDCHACHIHAHCFVPAHAKFAHDFLTLFHRPCATYL